MKKIVITAIIIGLISGSALAQTVSSANVVGFTKQTIPANAIRIVANSFFTTNEIGVTIGDAFGTALPADSEIYSWNGIKYSVYTYFEGIGWFDPDLNSASDVVIERGDAIWIRSGASFSTNSILSGNVPQSGSTTNTLVAGLNLISVPYPAGVQIKDLGINPVGDDELYLFNGAYNTYTYFDGIGWFDGDLNSADTIEIPAGVGFWYKTTSPRNWVVTIPYSL
jgi:hypothetical protein